MNVNYHYMNTGIAIFFLACLSQICQAQDWPNLQHYRTDNIELGPPPLDENRVVFMGNSITEEWQNLSPKFFSGRSYINRGKRRSEVRMTRVQSPGS